MENEKKRAYQKEYDRRTGYVSQKTYQGKCRQFKISVRKEKKEIIDFLESKDNITAYIMGLILEDMKKHDVPSGDDKPHKTEKKRK